MARRPTIVDVARHVGVSKSTVSLVLNGSPLVKIETSKAVKRSMTELNYVYNRAAANLRSAGAGLVGLVINDLRNPFFLEFAASLQTTFAKFGLATVIANTDDDPVVQNRIIGSMIEHGVSAFVISPAYGDPQTIVELASATGTPIFQVLRKLSEAGTSFPFATLDYQKGGMLATRHLAERGATKIAFVGGLSDAPVTNERLSGYLAYLQSAGAEPVTFFGRPSRVFGRDVARTVIENHPSIDAALCFNDLVALGMLSGFAQLGVRVGVDFRIAGFDDIEECELAFPRLTSVSYDIARFGVHCADTMASWLRTRKRPPDLQLFDVKLVVRESS